MSFPTATSSVILNEDGEVLGWDTPAYDDAPDVDDYYEADYGDDEDAETDDTPYMTEDYDFDNEYTAQEEDAWLDGSYED